MTFPALLKVETLDTRHPNYTADVWSELSDLYVGGYCIQKNAGKYLPRIPGESDAKYDVRKRCAGYVPYMGQIVEFFAANLFAREVTVTPADDPESADEFWDEFSQDADLAGHDLSKLLRRAFTDALVKGRGILACDFPAATAPVVTRADEEAAGLARGYAFPIEVEHLIDWEKDDHGRFTWCVLRREVERRSSVFVKRARAVAYKVWVMGPEFAEWAIYEDSEPDKKDVKGREIPLVAEGKTQFRRIPILELEVPEGLWVGNKIGPLAREHYQRRSLLVSAENHSMVAIPVAKLGPEFGAAGGEMPSEAQQNPHRGDDPVRQFETHGFLKIGAGDSFDFVAPDGGAYQVVDEQLAALVDEMFRVVHQMAASVSSTANAVGRSGDSKAEDRNATEIILTAYGSLVRDFAQTLYETLSEARGEDVEWQPHGLDKFRLTDKAALLEEALALASITIPSKTWRRMKLKELALGMLENVEPAVQAVITAELDSASDDEIMPPPPAEELTGGPNPRAGSAGPPKGGSPFGK